MVRTGGMMLMVATYALIASIVLATAASATSIAQIPITKATFPDCYWLPSSFGECQYASTSSDGAPCGQGIQNRDVTCYCDGKVQDGDTSVCSAVSVKPSLEQACSVDCASYVWTPSAWSGCTVECGVGYESRAVSCQNEQGVKVEGSHCPPPASVNQWPEESQLCAAPLCTPQHGNMTWNWGEWTSCSASCGTGHETRDRWCVGPDGIIDDTNCDCDAVSTYRSCNLGPCETYRWSETSFGDCSVECGTGFKTREVTCISSSRGLVANSECAAALGPFKGKTVELCPNKPCPHYGWEALGWGDCSVTCGEGERTQEVVCVELTTGTVVLKEYCSSIETVPDSVETCSAKKCEEWHWHVDSWSSCTATCGAAGTQFRTVTCVGWYPAPGSSYSLSSSDYSDVDSTDANCLEQRPDSFQECPAVASCPWCAYQPDGFGECSASCGGGVQTQSISCYCSDTGATSQADARCDEQLSLKTSFPSTQSCNTDVCYTYHWSYTPYGDCPVTCGLGYETRTATCVCDQTQQPVSQSLCPATDLLDTQRTCENAKCPLPHVVPGPWGGCSSSCGAGTAVREVHCVLTNKGVDTVVADDQCPDIATYATSQNCGAGNPCETFRETYTSWSDCSATCQGVQTRTATCVSDHRGVVSNKHCPGIPSQAVDQRCNTERCPIYEPRSSGFGNCSTTCDAGVRTQSWYCLETVSNTVVADSLCKELVVSSVSYPTTELCQNQACVTCQWIPGSYSTCSAECGAGTIQREVPCKCTDGTVDSTRCSGARPAQQDDCWAGACHTYKPSIQSWSSCSVTCGKGTHTRGVSCVRDDGVSVDLSFCSMTPEQFPTSETCTVCACEDQYFIPTFAYTQSGFGVCDVTCGSGYQHQTVGCQMTITETDHFDDGRPDVVTVNDPVDVELWRCTVVGPVPTTIKDCTLSKCPVPTWVPGVPSCDVTCGGGINSRSVVCKLNNKVVDDSQCTDEKPWTVGPCVLAPCETWRWEVSSYGACSVTCGLGVHTRTVQCISSLWGPVPLNNCQKIIKDIGTQPSDHEDCEDQKCVVCGWDAGSWADCSTTCGQGFKAREVSCQCSDGTSNPASCTGAGYANLVPCTQPACTEHFHWVPRTWSGCSATCGTSGVDTRVVECVGDFGTVDETGGQCADLVKPDTSRPCVETLPECTICHVVYGPFGDCSLTCGIGIETRTYSYANQHNQAVDVSQCAGQDLPLEPLIQDCLRPRCPVCQWQVASFSTCSVSCGIGAQSRDVACINQYGGVCADKECAGTAPVRSDECELACCTAYSWHTGPYGDCSLTCGQGTRTRDVYCHDTEGLVVDASYCEGDAPDTDAACFPSKCDEGTSSWANGEWSGCSASCGAGTRTRDVWCRNTDGTHVDNSKCSGPAPVSSDNCNLCGCESIDWEVTSWSACSASCGQGFITREVECRSTLRGYVSYSECTETRPHDHQVCAPVCYGYEAGEFGACTEGLQSRNVYCVGTDNGFSADGSHCAGQEIPQESQKCGNFPQPTPNIYT